MVGKAEFLGIYEKLSQYDVPLFLHPVRDRDIPDFTRVRKRQGIAHTSISGGPMKQRWPCLASC